MESRGYQYSMAWLFSWMLAVAAGLGAVQTGYTALVVYFLLMPTMFLAMRRPDDTLGCVRYAVWFVLTVPAFEYCTEFLAPHWDGPYRKKFIAVGLMATVMAGIPTLVGLRWMLLQPVVIDWIERHRDWKLLRWLPWEVDVCAKLWILGDVLLAWLRLY